MEYVWGIVVLILVLVLAYYSTKLIAKLNQGSGKSKYMQVVDRLILDQKTSIVIVEINGENQVIVLGEHAIENLGVVDSLNELPHDNKNFDMSFLTALYKNKERNEE